MKCRKSKTVNTEVYFVVTVW